MVRHNSMTTTLVFFFLFVCFSSFKLSFSAFLAPISQDPATRRFTLSLRLKSHPRPTSLLLDLGSSLSWVDCTTANNTIPCGSPLCNSLSSPAACSDGCFRPAYPACGANNSCHLLLSNPRNRRGVMVQVLVDKLALPVTDGRNPGQLRVIPEFVFSCSTRSALRGMLPKGMTGLAALGRSNFSLAAQVNAASASPKVFALCLSDSPSAPGVAFFGTAGPYNFFPEIDLSNHLDYTPLLSNHDFNNPSREYFIGLAAIKLAGNPVVQLNQTPSAFGRAKLSLRSPFTTLESSVYALLTKAFVNESAADLKLTTTTPVAPFSVCYDAAGVRDTNTGPAVPAIDLVIQGGGEEKVWRILGSNSMVRISRSSEGVDVWCLAFVDGGAKTRWPVVIGGHQMVDNLLQFDLDSERLGFSSSVLAHNTMCANFNFTVNASLTNGVGKSQQLI